MVRNILSGLLIAAALPAWAADQQRDASSAPPALAGRTVIGAMPANAGRAGFAIQAQDTSGNCAELGEGGLIVAFTGDATKTVFILDFASDKGAAGGSVTSNTMPQHTGQILYFGKPGCQVGAAEW